MRRQSESVEEAGSVPSPKNLIALWFDDGPAERTDDVLALLGEHDAVATFFVLGRQVEGQESALHRVADGGHELGNHTFSHPDLRALEPTLIEDELVRTSAAIERTVGVRPRLMRPPYGRGIRRAAPVATRLGMTT
jgi:peptidoglycan/xylan/chitin deacetylase (PgdA/CDA1 family)